jgi:transposase
MKARGSRSVSDIADDLGVATSQLYRWVQEHGAEPTATSGPTPDELAAENKRLRKQIERLETEKAILKKAAALFAKEDE